MLIKLIIVSSITFFSCVLWEISIDNPYCFRKHKTNLSSIKHPSEHFSNALKDAMDHVNATLIISIVILCTAVFYFPTDKDAPTEKLVPSDVRFPTKENVHVPISFV